MQSCDLQQCKYLASSLVLFRFLGDHHVLGAVDESFPPALKALFESRLGESIFGKGASGFTHREVLLWRKGQRFVYRISKRFRVSRVEAWCQKSSKWVVPVFWPLYGTTMSISGPAEACTIGMSPAA